MNPGLSFRLRYTGIQPGYCLKFCLKLDIVTKLFRVHTQKQIKQNIQKLQEEVIY